MSGLKIKTRRCWTCGARGLGPGAVKLFPFEDRLYCAEDFKAALEWDSRRDTVTGGIKHVITFEKAAQLIRRYGRKPAVVRVSNWTPYIWDLCTMAEFGLLRGDRKTFVHYFARAMYAWTLKEVR